MVAIGIAAALVLGIALFQVVQGFFSALIMAVLTVLSAAFAFGYYEPLAEMLYSRQPAYADAAALVALFVIVLLVLRYLFDRLIGGNVVLGVWVDRIGGGAAGIVTGMVVVGVLAVAVQLLPFRPTILYFTPFDDSLQRNQRLVPFYPDEFTLALVNTLSRGSIAGERPFDVSHDNLLLEAFCTRNTAGLAGRVDALPDSLLLLGAHEAPERRLAAWVDEVPLAEGDITTKVIIVRVAVSESARNEKDNWWRLPATHFRLVTESGQSHYPVGYLVREGNKWQCVAAPLEDDRPQVAKLVVQREFFKGKTELVVDWLYRLPLEDKPQYVVFRRVAKARLGKLAPGMPRAKGALIRNPNARRRRR